MELASGIDALYLSGRAALPNELLDYLESARNEAEVTGQPSPVLLGGEPFDVAAHGFQRYHFSLSNPYGRVGITSSKALPAIRIQPRAEFLHGAGPRGVVEWYRRILEAEFGPVLFTVSRIDLFADFQGWTLDGDARQEFVTRARKRHTYEENEVFNGFVFGSRDTGAILARIYDKTIESAKKGSGFWPVIWGKRYDPRERVLRVEFEIGRDALRAYGVNTPEQAFDAAGALWAALTRGWLTHRTPTTDQTHSRWPVSPQWEDVRRARIGEDDWGIARIYGAQQRATLASMMPVVAGYLARFGALTDSATFGEMLPFLGDHLAQYGHDSGVPLKERIAQKRKELGLP